MTALLSIAGSASGSSSALAGGVVGATAGGVPAANGYNNGDAPDGAFERVTALAARLFDVPIAIVNIVDQDRIWFKSYLGLDAEEIRRDFGLGVPTIAQHFPRALTDADIDPRTLANPVVADALGLRFHLGAPLTTPDGESLGTLCVIDKTARPVSDKDVAVLTALAAMVVDELELRRLAGRTLELEQQLRHQAEELTTALQTSLLPPILPVIPGLDIAAMFRPADGAPVGGDFYDVFPVTLETWAFVIGDVCGKGPLAASRSALVRYTLRGATIHGDTPAKTLERVNQALLAGDHLDESFCTLIFGLIDTSGDGHRVRLAVGGHPLPSLLRPDGTVIAVGRSGSIVGSFAGTEFYDDEVLVEPGDTLVLVTDGLVEIHTEDGVSGRTEFESRLEACAGLPPVGVIESLATAMDINHDDAAILVLQAR
jgi:phosphoserine phosphatase RsbU/P